MRYITTIDRRGYLVEILDDRHVSVDDVIYNIDFGEVSEEIIFSLLVDNRSFEAFVYPGDEGWQVLLLGNQYTVTVEDEREKRLRASLAGRIAEHLEFHLKAPMPGLVVSVPVSEGQEIAKGDVLVVLESMKMQNELKSPRPGRVSRLRVKSGDRVELRETLLSVV